MMHHSSHSREIQHTCRTSEFESRLNSRHRPNFPCILLNSSDAVRTCCADRDMIAALFEIVNVASGDAANTGTLHTLGGDGRSAWRNGLLLRNADRTQTGSGNTDRTQTESTNADRTQTESTNADRTQTESTNADRTQTESTDADRTQTESTDADRTQTESTNAD